MATEEITFQPELDADSSRTWVYGLLWFVIAGLAWFLFELTANSALVAVVACLKFGWYDFRNGLWLWRNDSHKTRGLTCFFFYLALAFWKISLTAVALTIGILIVTSSLQLKLPGAEMVGALLSLWVSCGLATILTWAGGGMAWKFGHKIWVDSTVTWFRKNQVWPPEPYGTNKLNALLLAAGIVAVTASLIFSIVIGVAIAENNQVQGGWLLIGVVVLLVLIPGGMLVMTDFLSRTITPMSPTGCWQKSVSPQGSKVADETSTNWGAEWPDNA